MSLLFPSRLLIHGQNLIKMIKLQKLKIKKKKYSNFSYFNIYLYKLL